MKENLEDDEENNIIIPLIQKDEIKIKNEIINENEKPLNIFFCSNEKNGVFTKIKNLLKDSSKKFKIKGEYNTESVVNEVCYYLGIEAKEFNEIDEKEIQNIIIFNISFKEAGSVLEKFIKKIDSSIGNDEFPFFIFYRDQNSEMILTLNN